MSGTIMNPDGTPHAPTDPRSELEHAVHDLAGSETTLGAVDGHDETMLALKIVLGVLIALCVILIAAIWSDRAKTSKWDPGLAPKSDDSSVMIILRWGSLLVGLVTLVAGGMGIMWGVPTLELWPPYTWNHFSGGIFMALFGLFIVVMSVDKPGKDGEKVHGWFKSHFGFLNHYLGRGLFFIFIGLRVVTLGKTYCLVAGMCIGGFALINIAVHYTLSDLIEAERRDTYVYQDLHPEPKAELKELYCCGCDLKSLVRWGSLLVGLVTLVAGGMGMMWGVPTLELWPPYTWNHFSGGIFMAVFGLAITIMSIDKQILGEKVHGWFMSNFGFLNHYLGRGLFFIYIGLRVVTLGKYYCLVAGMCIAGFALINIAVHFSLSDKNDVGMDAM